MSRSLSILLACGFLLVGSLAFATGATAITAIGATTTCANGEDTTPGLGVICETTVVNTITPTGGSAVVTVRECHGAAGDPEAACTTETMNLTEPVFEVNQCNGTTSSGATLRCSVDITNEFVDSDPSPTAVTVNQCVGSGDGDTTGCDPTPASTTGAAITQCNGTANGLTLVELTCTASGTMSPGFSVTVNQCNGSANGGGSLVICSATIDNVEVAGATPAPTATPTAPGGGATPRPTPRGTPPATDTLPMSGAAGPGSAAGAVFAILSVAFVVLVAGHRSGRAMRRR